MNPLRHSGNRDASDPQDSAYAFLGLAHRGHVISPDYSIRNTTVRILIDTARRIIGCENSLHILEHGSEKLGYLLPTWVPDWTSDSDYGFKEYTSFLSAHQEYRPFDASKGLPAEAKFREDKADKALVDMKVKGIPVEALGELEGPVQDFAYLQSFLTPSGQRVITPKSALLGDEVWVLHGASKPVVLRPEDDYTYSYLGEALVCEEDGSFSDIMFGEMIDLAMADIAETRDIWLV
jgi:hypothetical protein